MQLRKKIDKLLCRGLQSIYRCAHIAKCNYLRAGKLYGYKRLTLSTHSNSTRDEPHLSANFTLSEPCADTSEVELPTH